jgi:hypothetical protein
MHIIDVYELIRHVVIKDLSRLPPVIEDFMRFIIHIKAVVNRLLPLCYS